MIRSCMSDVPEDDYDRIFRDKKEPCDHPCTYVYKGTTTELCLRCNTVISGDKSVVREVGAVSGCHHPIVNIAADGSEVCEICKEELNG